MLLIQLFLLEILSIDYKFQISLFDMCCRGAMRRPMNSTRRTLAGLRVSFLPPNKLVGEPLSLCKPHTLTTYCVQYNIKSRHSMVS